MRMQPERKALADRKLSLTPSLAPTPTRWLPKNDDEFLIQGV